MPANSDRSASSASVLLATTGLPTASRQLSCKAALSLHAIAAICLLVAAALLLLTASTGTQRQQEPAGTATWPVTAQAPRQLKSQILDGSLSRVASVRAAVVDDSVRITMAAAAATSTSLAGTLHDVNLVRRWKSSPTVTADTENVVSLTHKPGVNKLERTSRKEWERNMEFPSMGPGRQARLFARLIRLRRPEPPRTSRSVALGPSQPDLPPTPSSSDIAQAVSSSARQFYSGCLSGPMEGYATLPATIDHASDLPEENHAPAVLPGHAGAVGSPSYRTAAPLTPGAGESDKVAARLRFFHIAKTGGTTFNTFFQ